jgi:signal transduction histidine kinase/GGDEF domain-containing protein
VKSKVLVVDDEREIRNLLSEALTEMGGFEVELAASAEEALNKIGQRNFDLVLTDIKMDGVDGLHLLTEISRSRPDILTVLMTGHGSIDSALEAMRRGACDYLTKPLNLDEMIVRLRKVVEERQSLLKIKDYAAQLERANQEFRKIDEMKSEFVSVASHELRTPLATIKNAIQLILRGKAGEINETQSNFLSMAEKNINRLTSILNDILDLSRIESGRTEMKSEELDLREVIEFIFSSLKPQADAKSIQLTKEIAAGFPLVYADREKIEQILTNLIGNSVKFTPEGGKISVLARVFDEAGKMVAISVSDSGIGIPGDQLDKVFKKFYQVEGSLHRSSGGTGLGLAITKGLVEAGEGTIWVESEVGKGSTFTFTLPVSKGEKRDPRFRLALDKAFQRVQENEGSLSLFLIGILNEGGETKDVLFNTLEEQVKKCLYRKSDVILRREKEGILAIICEADLKGALVIRHRIEEEIQKVLVKANPNPPTIKLGVATYPEEALSKRELFRRAKDQMRG